MAALSADNSMQLSITLFVRKLVLLCACLLGTAAACLGQITVSFPESHNVVVLSVPDQSAALKVDLLRLKVASNNLSQDAAARRLQASDSHGWVFSSFIFPRDRALNSKDLRETEWASLRKGLPEKGMKPEQLRLYEKGSIPMLEYTIEDFQGRKVHQKNVFGYIVSGNTAMDFHISKMIFAPEDQKFLDNLINGIALIENYEPDGKLEYGYGSVFYLQKNWRRASAHYEKALELERAKRTLSVTEWRVLVDNLGMSYAMAGDIARSKSTLEYGTSQDATYPMFHYNLACAYAETSDLDNALEQLKIAFRCRNNSIRGEGIPDPAKDESFKRYLGERRFQTLAGELCPNSKKSDRGWVCQ